MMMAITNHDRAQSILSLDPREGRSFYVRQRARYTKGRRTSYPHEIPYCYERITYRFIKPRLIIDKALRWRRAPKDYWELHPNYQQLSWQQRDPTTSEARALARRYNRGPKEPICQQRLHNLRYGLFYQYHPKNGAAPLTFPAMRRALPEKVQRYYQTAEEHGQLISYLRRIDRLFLFAKMISTDEHTVETRSGSITDAIYDELGLHVVKEPKRDMRSLIRDIVDLGLRHGMDEGELAAIALDLMSPRKNTSTRYTKMSQSNEFICGLRAVVFLRVALALHHENIAAGGFGIMKDFERFVQTIEPLIRDGSIGFRVLPVSIGGTGIGGIYHAPRNVIRYPVPTVKTSLLAHMPIMIHELYHAYQDALNRRQSRLMTEEEAYEVSMKIRILLGRLLYRQTGIRFDLLLKRARRFKTHARTADYERMKAPPSVSSFMQQLDRARIENYWNAFDSFELQLRGIRTPEANEYLHNFARPYLFRYSIGVFRRWGLERFARFEERGDQWAISFITNGAISDYVHRLAGLTRERPLTHAYHYNFYMLLIDAMAVWGTAYLTGTRETWRNLSEIVFETALPHLLKHFHHVPANRDGI